MPARPGGPILTHADSACFQLRERIITLAMSPGSTIHEADLMADLKLGRTPIREALKQLEMENLVRITPHLGIFVTEITINDLQHVCEVRSELEPLCAWLAAQRITSSQLAEMKTLVARREEEIKEEMQQVMALDRQFHHLLAEAAGNKFLARQLEQFYNLSLRIWYLYLDRFRPEEVDLTIYADILAALETGNSEGARAAMQKHLENFQDVLKRLL
jgi:DNA-binding GntR family transcriptional regulator